MSTLHDPSNTQRGPVVTIPPGKIRITIRIDDDVLTWFKEQVNLAGGGSYQTLMNQALRKFIESETEPIESTLRRVIREELKTAPLKKDSPDADQQGTIAESCSPLPLDESVKEQIADLCVRWNIRRLALFGSTIRDDHRPDSDIDILVEFEPGHVPGFDFITIQDELTAILGRQVDLHTPATLSRYFRDDVLDQARTVYDAA
jgi:predicted nucleotidyltransferase